MTEELKKTIENETAELPKEMQEVINASNWVKIAEDIAKQNGLDEEEIEDYQLETLLVLIGAVDAEFYAINIENHANQTKEKSEKLAKESFEKIFTPIAQTLEEKAKKNLENNNPNHKQNVDFILSGGNYSAFITDKPKNPANLTTPAVKPPTLKDIKDNLVI